MLVGVFCGVERRNGRRFARRAERAFGVHCNVHELAVLGAHSVREQRIVQGRPELHAHELQQEEADQYAEPRASRGGSSGYAAWLHALSQASSPQSGKRSGPRLLRSHLYS